MTAIFSWIFYHSFLCSCFITLIYLPEYWTCVYSNSVCHSSSYYTPPTLYHAKLITTSTITTLHLSLSRKYSPIKGIICHPTSNCSFMTSHLQNGHTLCQCNCFKQWKNPQSAFWPRKINNKVSSWQSPALKASLTICLYKSWLMPSSSLLQEMRICSALWGPREGGWLP